MKGKGPGEDNKVVNSDHPVPVAFVEARPARGQVASRHRGVGGSRRRWKENALRGDPIRKQEVNLGREEQGRLREALCRQPQWVPIPTEGRRVRRCGAERGRGTATGRAPQACPAGRGPATIKGPGTCFPAFPPPPHPHPDPPTPLTIWLPG